MLAELAARRDDPQAHTLIGRIYAEGLGVPKDEGTAARWYARAAELGGHACAFRGGDRGGEVFQPLSAPLATIHRRLKQAFDPAGIFNPGRLYAEF